MTAKNEKLLLLLGLSLTAAACVGPGPRRGREIAYVNGCEQRLGDPEKRAECLDCVQRPRPHLYLPDRYDGDRCVPR